MSTSYGMVLSIVFCLSPLGFSQQAGSPTIPAAPPVSALPPARISLDVLVIDKAGKPVPELEPTDFTLLDDNQPRKILSFRRTDGTVGNKFDTPTEVIIVLDSVNMAYQAVTQLRLQLQRFLRQNGGHLAQPTSIFVFGSEGLRVQPAPSKDGNGMAAMINTAAGTMRSRNTAAGDFG